MISTVAVGTDGSSTASEAVKAAAEIAKRFDAKLVLLSASSDSHRGSHSPDEHEWAHNPHARLREILSRAEEEYRAQNIDCTSMVDEGDPADVLIKLAEECNADVLVVGNRGMQRRVLGSVPNSVAHKAPCSVYVVKTT